MSAADRSPAPDTVRPAEACPTASEHVQAAPQRVWSRAAGRARQVARSPVASQLIILACYLAAGIAVTWPRASYLVRHELPATRDAGAFVWDFWWLAHQVAHLGNPWFTPAVAAPVGAQLGLHALMPLEGLLMTPVTLAFGPAASYNILSAAVPGLLCYAMYRAARLWLRSAAGAIAAGAFFGLSSMLTWRSWYHLNLAVGALFLPLTLEAAVRLRRKPGYRQAVILGLVLGACLLTDQESAVLAAIVAALVLLTALARRPDRAHTVPLLRAAGLAVLVAAAAGSPQLAAVAAQAAAGGAGGSMHQFAQYYTGYGVGLAGLAAPSPRVAAYGLTGLGGIYYHAGVVYQTAGRHIPASEGTPMFGLVLSVLALAGLLVSWRRRSAWLLALLWLGAAALALGPVLWIGSHAYVPVPRMLAGVRVSSVLPYTWFVQIPGLSGFREPARLAELGLLAAALLAGAAVDWLRYHARPALAVPAIAAVAAAGIVEAGWSGNLPATVMPAVYRVGTMPTARPTLDAPIAADPSGSIVVDYPYGIAGGTATYGARFNPGAQVLGTADGHPRAVAFLARIPAPTLTGISRHPFYTALIRIWHGGRRETRADLTAARLDAHAMHVGWVLVWPQQHQVGNGQVTFRNPGVVSFLTHTGFRFAYTADGVMVYRATWLRANGVHPG